MRRRKRLLRRLRVTGVREVEERRGDMNKLMLLLILFLSSCATVQTKASTSACPDKDVAFMTTLGIAVIVPKDFFSEENHENELWFYLDEFEDAETPGLETRVIR